MGGGTPDTYDATTVGRVHDVGGCGLRVLTVYLRRKGRLVQ